MKLLLTSNGLSNEKLKKEFVKLLEKPAEKTSVLVMRATSKSKEQDEYFEEIKTELEECGILEKNIIFANIKQDINANDFENLDFDILWSCGGNTFIILDRIRKTGFDKLIKQSIKKGKIYVGTSAGSILLSKTIETAGMSSERDENYINLKDLRGLNIIKKAIFPHYLPELERELEEIKRKVPYPILALEDEQALLITDKEEKIIS